MVRCKRAAGHDVNLPCIRRPGAKARPIGPHRGPHGAVFVNPAQINCHMRARFVMQMLSNSFRVSTKMQGLTTEVYSIGVSLEPDYSAGRIC